MDKTFKKYDSLRDDIFKYFGYESYDLGIEFELETDWDTDENTVCWMSDGDLYSEEVRSIHRGPDYTLFVISLCTGGKSISIFKNSNRKIGLDDEQ